MKNAINSLLEFSRDFDVDSENGLIIAGGVALAVTVLLIAFL